MEESPVICKKIKRGYILPSAAFTLKASQLKYYRELDRKPELGDVVYGRIVQVGQHSSLENRSGRIHTIHNGTMAIFVFSNRYAPDYYEAFVPEEFSPQVDLIARSGAICRALLFFVGFYFAESAGFTFEMIFVANGCGRWVDVEVEKGIQPVA